MFKLKLVKYDLVSLDKEVETNFCAMKSFKKCNGRERIVIETLSMQS